MLILGRKKKKSGGVNSINTGVKFLDCNLYETGSTDLFMYTKLTVLLSRDAKLDLSADGLKAY